MKRKQLHISSFTELTKLGEHPFIWEANSFIELNSKNDLEKNQKEDLEKLKLLLDKLKKLSQSED